MRPEVHRIRAVEAWEKGVKIAWADDHVSHFHAAWLRDNCPCGLCRHPSTLELLLDQTTVPGDIRPSRIDVLRGELRIVWEGDGHLSLFDPAWLRARCYSGAAREARRRRPISWEPTLRSVMPVLDGDAVLSDDGALLAWLRGARDVGTALLRGVPCDLGAVGRVARRVAFAQRTHFGLIFDVRPKPRPTSNAYTALALPLHTDLPHHAHPPGFQLLHCLVNDAEGGASLLADGFCIAEALRASDPGAFELLTRLPVSFRYQDDGADHVHQGPLIALDEGGRVRAIRFAPNVVAPLDVPAEAMEAMRDAYQRFAAMTEDPRFQERVRLAPGDLLVTDNHRVLHGRTAFDPRTGERHLRGCYVDGAEWLSRIRVLERARRPEAAGGWNTDQVETV